MKELELIKTIPCSTLVVLGNICYLEASQDNYQLFRNLSISFYYIDRKTKKKVIESVKVGTNEGVNSKVENTDIDLTEIKSHPVIPHVGTSEEAGISNYSGGKLSIIFSKPNLLITMPYKKREVDFVRSLKGSWWSSQYKNWVVKASLSNMEAIQERYGYWEPSTYQKLYDIMASIYNPQKVELYTTPEFPNCFVMKLKGHNMSYEFVKRLQKRHYDKIHKRWIFPMKKEFVERIIQYYKDCGCLVLNRLPKKDSHYLQTEYSNGKRIEFLLKRFPKEFHSEMENYISGLVRMRYSWNTIRLYTSAYFKFLQFLSPRIPQESDANDVNLYLSSLSRMNVSDSLIHASVNAIKFYYEKVIFLPDFQIDQIQRPRKKFRLPSILSIGEVDRMLRSLKNLKHITILYCLYGMGVRLNELLSIKLEDIYWDRNQVVVRQGKGNKDRYVMLSPILKDLLVFYFDNYQPEYWLFEGAKKGSAYSRRSVAKVVKKAAREAGMTRRVTPHTLRHCFATHLLDNGTDIRFIQELLGHKDIKTTLIYTHVTTRNIGNIGSPLDRLPSGGEMLGIQKSET